MKLFIYIGYGINFLSIPLILLVALHRPLVQAIILFFVRIGAKLRIIKRPEEKIVRLGRGHGYVPYVHPAADEISQADHLAAAVRGAEPGVADEHSAERVPCVRLSGVHWYQLLAVSFLLFISASYTPLPGASGAQEGGFLLFFAGAFTQGTIGLALLVWRFFAYYLFLLIGAVISIIGSLRGHRADKEKGRTGRRYG